jgi:co-chaperonin GroES (HSP10)
MEHLYNTIKPVGKRVVIAVRSGEKDSHKVIRDDGTEVELFVNTNYSWDGKISNHTQGTLLTDFKNLKAGTNVLFNHNSISDENKLDIEPDNITSVYAIESNMLHFGVKDDQVICIDGFMLAERMYEEEAKFGSIILADKKKKECMLKILAKPESITEFEVGDIAIVYKYSDYEMTHNIGGKRTTLIRLKYTDCIGKWEN